MPKNRYFSKQLFKKNSFISIQGQEANHMLIIMRKKKNDEVEIINGKGFLAKAKIINIFKKEIKLEIKQIFFEKEKKQKLILIQSIIKPDRLEFILEKCTELGVDEFLFWSFKNSPKVYFSKNKLDRMQNILIAAIKQCGRLYLPKINFLNSLNSLTKIKGLFFLGSTQKNIPKLIEAYKTNNRNIYFIIGPESGLTKEETIFLNNDLKANLVNLNENILRSETAAISATAIVSHLLQP